MGFRWVFSRAGVVVLLLALVAAPLASAAFAAVDAHGCCPEPASAVEDPLPCQYVAPLGCCAQLAVPATQRSDESQASPVLLAFAAAPAVLAPPRAIGFAHPRSAHGPPQAWRIRSTVLQL